MKARIKLLPLLAITTASIAFVVACAPPPNHQEPTPNARYEITLYDQGAPVGNWHANSWDAGVFSLYFTVPGNRYYYNISGTYVLEPEGSPRGTPRDGAFYTAELYSGGKVVRSWYITSFSGGDNAAYIRPTGTKEETRVSGTYIIRPLL